MLRLVVEGALQAYSTGVHIVDLLVMSNADGIITKALAELGAQEPVDWGYDVTRKVGANRFLFTCAMDYQMNSETVWRNARTFIDNVLNDPKDLWRAIRRRNEIDWSTLCRKHRLHRFPQAWIRLWRIAGHVEAGFAGDARRIWRSADSPAAVVETLESIGFGEQLSRMAAGALKDQGQIRGCSHVKADLHVRRVIGRLMDGESATAERATELTKRLCPRDPWKLDRGLFLLGKTQCKPEPTCDECTLNNVCAFAQANAVSK